MSPESWGGVGGGGKEQTIQGFAGHVRALDFN